MEAVTGADLSFVNLGITIEHLPNSITVFGFRIAFYGIIIGLGMLAGMAIACSDAKRRGQDPDIYLDFALYAIIFSIMGARAYYVIFDWANYKDDLLQIFEPQGRWTGYLRGCHCGGPDSHRIYEETKAVLFLHG